MWVATDYVKRLCLAVLFAFICAQGQIADADVIVDFGDSDSLDNLPYAEKGINVSQNPGSAVWGIGGQPGETNRSLFTGTNGLSSVRFTSTIGLIDLVSFKTIGGRVFGSQWEVFASNGSSFLIPAASSQLQVRTFTFDNAQWSNITHFDVFANGANASIRLDDINCRVSAVPEPSSVVFLGLGGIAMCVVAYRRKLKQSAYPEQTVSLAKL